MIKKIILSVLLVFSFILSQDTTVVISSDPSIFTLDTKNPLVEWASPNGGETYDSGGTMAGEWSAQDDSFGEAPVSVYLATSIGGSFNPLAEGIENTGTADFYLPEVNTAYARMLINVIDHFGNTAQDYGDGYFTIGDPQAPGYGSTDTTLVITNIPAIFTLDTKDPLVEWVSPNGGETYDSGSTMTGQWSAQDDSFDATPVSVYLSASIGGTFDPLAVGIANTESAEFGLPEANTAYARMFITVMDIFGNTAQDHGDGYFTIGEPPEVIELEDTTSVFTSDTTLFTLDTKDPVIEQISPNGGEHYDSGETIAVEWYGEDDSFGDEAIDIHIATEIGGYFSPLIEDIPNLMIYNVDFPETDRAFVRIKLMAIDEFGNTAEDFSDGYFIIGDPFGDYNVNDYEDMVIVDWGWGDYELIFVSNAALDFLELGDEIHVVDEHGIIVQGCDQEPDEIYGMVSVAQDIYEADRNVMLYCSKSVDYCEEGGDRYPGYVEWNPITYLFHDVSADEYFTMEAEYQFGYGYFGAPNGMEGGHNFLMVLYDQSSGEVYTYPQWFEGWVNNNGAPMPGYDNPEVVYDFSSSGNGEWPVFTFDDFQTVPTNQSGTVVGTLTIDGSPASSGDMIAAFDEYGHCVGTSAVTVHDGTGYMVMPVYGDAGMGPIVSSFSPTEERDWFDDGGMVIQTRSFDTFNIYRDNVLVAENHNSYFFLDEEVDEGEEYCYTVVLLDDEGNELVTSIELCATTSTSSTTIIDVPDDYPTIQSAIDAAAEGDTVLVQPGTYVENINYSGKNIVVGSLTLTTGDTSFISQTIIDGNEIGSVVTFESGENLSAVLNGFSIKNGNAATEGGGIRIQDSDPFLTNLNIFDCNGYEYGGGLYFGNSNSILEDITISNNEAEKGGGIYLNSSLPVLTNVNITNNLAHFGGGGVFAYQGSFIFQGVTILGNSTETALFWIPSDGGGLYLSEVDSPILTDVTIKNNSADDAGGGIYFSVYSVPVFDTTNRCNIYSNAASVGNDLDATDNFFGSDADSIIHVVLDTFTVIQPTEYYVNPLENFSFDILNGFLDQEDSGELYVSPEGDDTNSGLSWDEPLRTINHAISIIFVDDEHPGVIHLASGLYSSETNGEVFPLNLISNITLLGNGSDETVIDAGFRAPSVNNVRDYQGINVGSYFEDSGFIDRTSLHINVSDMDVYETIYFDENGGTYRDDDQSRECPDGFVDDCSGDGDCCQEGMIGDGYPDCEDQIWGCDLTCYENDGGDCDNPTMPSSVMIMNNVENIVIKNLKIMGGAGSTSGSYPESGGGINSVNSSSELENISLSKNVAMFAGGITVVSSNMDIINVTVDSNYAYNRGGGLEISMSDVHIGSNQRGRTRISGNSGMEGGGMYIRDDDERARSNTRDDTLLLRSNLTFSGVVIRDNNASYRGGGIYNAKDGSGIVFDPGNRSSIYSNTAFLGNDLYSTSPLDVVLDSFTVTSPSDHRAYPTPLYSFDILNGVLADVEIDVEQPAFYYAPDTGYVVVEFPVEVLNGDISDVTFEWDFNRDGVTDWTETGNSSALYTFTEVGFETADLLYTDPEGNSNRLSLNLSVKEFDSDASGFEGGVVLNWGFGDVQPVLIATAALEFMAAGDQLHIIDMEGILEQGCTSADNTGPVSVGHYVYDGSGGDTYYAINAYQNYENCNLEYESTWNYMNTGEVPAFVIYDASEYSYYSVEVSNAVPFQNNDISVIETISALNLIAPPLSLQSGESLTQAHCLVQNATVNGEPLVGAAYDSNGELTNEPDIIYAFRDSVCVGSQMWTGSYTDITINGNDGGNSYPGFVDGSQMSFMHYDAGADAYTYLTPQYQSGIGAFRTPNGGMLSGMDFHLVLYDQSEDITYTYPQLFEGWTHTGGDPMPGYDDHTAVYDFSSSGSGDWPAFTFDDFTPIPSNQSGTVLGTVTIDGVPAEAGDWIGAFNEYGYCSGATDLGISEGTANINLPIYGDGGFGPVVSSFSQQGLSVDDTDLHNTAGVNRDNEVFNVYRNENIILENYNQFVFFDNDMDPSIENCYDIYLVGEDGEEIPLTMGQCVDLSGDGSALEVSYQSGWNMVGLPVLVDDAYYQTLFPEAYTGALYSYDNSYQLETILTPGTGYLLRLASGGTTSFSGLLINELTLTLTEGWNLISGISTAVDADVLYNSGLVVTGGIYGYDASYFNADVINPGMGYWVRAIQDGEITLSSTALAAKTGEQVNHLEGSNTLELSNGTRSSTLYFGKDVAEEHRNSYSLPPTFPQMAFDVRFDEDMKYTVETGDIEVLNTSDNLTISYDIVIEAGEHMNWVLSSESGEEYILEGTGEITIPTEETFTLERKAIIPIAYTLHQNYPNPFNPITALRYDLPEQAHVTLTIYDLMGREVTQLVNTVQDAGYRSVQWDATNMNGKPVSAGVYLYQIRAGEFVRTKKMVLLK